MRTRACALLGAALCVGVVASSLAWSDVPARCGNELRDPGFEKAWEHWRKAPATGGADVTENAKHWGNKGLSGASNSTVYQIFDETLIWEGDTKEQNPCWDPDMPWKRFDLTAWVRLRGPNDAVSFQVLWWCNEFGDNKPEYNTQTNWTSWKKYDTNSLTSDTWHEVKPFKQYPIRDCQPRWMTVHMTFVDVPYVDDLRVEGECTPELGTWALLLATGAIGGWIKRRRRE